MSLCILHVDHMVKPGRPIQSASSNPSRVHHHSLLQTDGLVTDRYESKDNDAFAVIVTQFEARGAATRWGLHPTSS